jgi:cytochrome c-type biogenesis protein CcmH
VAIPLIAGSLYVGLGSPNLPGRPHDTKSAASDTGAVTGTKPDAADLGQLINQVEARLRQAPDDGRGWDVIAPVYLRDQRFADAKFAYARAIELQGPSAARLMGFGESAIRMSDGVVTVEARTAFEKVLAIEPARIEPRYWIAVAREQAGDLAQAAADYRALLSTAPSDAPWRAGVALRLAAIAPVAGPTPLSAIQRGPTAEQAAAAASMTPEQRQQMIASMVDGLHARLKTTDTGDAAGWLRLVRAYATMGEESKARAALSEARLAVAGDLQGLAAIDGLAKEMGYAR